MSSTQGSVGGFSNNLNEIVDSEQTSEQNNQFTYYPDLWVGQPLGVILREFRRSYDLSLHQVSDELKIRSVYLDYIEKGEYELLPGQVYGQGFVRSYASYLGLPPEEMLALYRAETSGGRPTETYESVSAALSGDRTTPSIGVFLGVLLGIGVLAYVLFFIYSRLSFGGDEEAGENQVPIFERISTFIFGTDEVAAPKPAVNENDANLLAGAGPIIVGVDGTVSVAPSPKPLASPTAQPTQTPSTSTPAQNPPAELQASFFPDGKTPLPKLKPDFSALAGQTVQVPAPRNETSALISNVDPNVPLISPQAVNIGTSAFGQGVGFNSPTVSLTGVPNNAPNIANTAPIVSDTTVQVPTVEAQPVQQTLEPFTQSPEEPNEQPIDTATNQTATNQAAPIDGDGIVIKAVARTWIKVVASDGSTLAEQLLATNDTFDVPDQAELKLLTGSLKSLALTVGGRSVKTPASVSQRTDTIMLDAQALLNQR